MCSICSGKSVDLQEVYQKMWPLQNCKEFVCIDGASTESGVIHFIRNQNTGYENQEQKKT